VVKMGIKDLTKLLKACEIDYEKSVKLSEFAGYRVGVDFMIWFFKNCRIQAGHILNNLSDPVEDFNDDLVIKNLVGLFISFNNKFLGEGVLPIWVLDGKSHDLKSKTKKKRIDSNKDKKDRIEAVRNMTPLERMDQQIIETYIKDMSTTYIMSYEKKNEFIEIMKSTGIPVITAKTEGEAFATGLAIDRKVAAVWTVDSDAYAIGAPIVINEWTSYSSPVKIKAVCLDDILRPSYEKVEGGIKVKKNGLGMSYEHFKDLCILLGTDFNEGLMGMKTALKCIRKHGSVEKVIEHEKCNYNLTHEELAEIRKLMTYDEYDSEVMLDVDKSVMNDKWWKNFYELDTKYGPIKEFISFARNIKEIEVSDVPS